MSPSTSRAPLLGITHRPVGEAVLDHDDAWRRLRRPVRYDRVDA